MALLRENLRDEVNSNLGDRDDGEVEPGLTRLNRALDLAQLRIARQHDYKEMFVLDTDTVAVVGTPAMDRLYTGLPSTIKDIYGLVYQKAASDTAYKLTQVLPRQWDQLVGDPQAFSTQERPTHYLLWGGSIGMQLEWFPIPSAGFILTRRYSKWPSAMVEGSASELLNKDDLIIAWATHHVFQSLGQKDDAVRWFTIAKDLEAQAVMEDNSRPDQSTVWRGTNEASVSAPDYWRDPFVREDP